MSNNKFANIKTVNFCDYNFNMLYKTSISFPNVRTVTVLINYAQASLFYLTTLCVEDLLSL